MNKKTPYRVFVDHGKGGSTTTMFGMNLKPCPKCSKLLVPGVDCPLCAAMVKLDDVTRLPYVEAIAVLLSVSHKTSIQTMYDALLKQGYELVKMPEEKKSVGMGGGP